MSFFKKKKTAAEEAEIIQQEILNEEKKDMIQGVEDLSKTSVKEVMIPRIDVDFISSDTPQDELFNKIVASGHSRFPLYTDSIDNVIGVLYVKDIIKCLAEKKEIAKRAAQEIKEGDIIFLDTSTTVLPVLDYIPDIRLTVVTNSLPAMVRLSERHKIKSIACPGHYQELYGGLMDISTVEYLRSYHFQKAFLGASMCDPDFGISCDEEIEAAIKKTVLAQSDHSYLLIDYSKMNSRTFIKISDVDVFDAVFTNAQLNQTMKEIYAANGGKLVFC